MFQQRHGFETACKDHGGCRVFCDSAPPKKASLGAAYFKTLCEFLEGLKRNVTLACSSVAYEPPGMCGSPTESGNVDDKRFISIVVF